jgi:hypothetical protein
LSARRNYDWQWLSEAGLRILVRKRKQAEASASLSA